MPNSYPNQPNIIVIVLVAGGLLLAGVLFGLTRLSSTSGAGNAVADSEVITQEESAAPFAPDQPGIAGGLDTRACEGYTVRAGDTLSAIANRTGFTMRELVVENGLEDANRIAVGQRLCLPGGSAAAVIQVTSINAPAFPNDELVYGPNAKDLDIASPDIVPADSFLRSYTGEVEGAALDGVSIVKLVAERTRVHPRLLLAALEHRAGWVTQAEPAVTAAPFGAPVDPGLYQQLDWAANQFNMGFYGRREGGMVRFQLADGTAVDFAADSGDATSAIQYWVGAAGDAANWQRDIVEEGFIETYRRLFGDPFAYSLGDASVEVQGEQPLLGLPWAEGETWFFTGGPHGGWNTGSAWAALDFVPPGNQLGCYDSPAWLLASADGVVARSEYGNVVLDLDGDGYQGTGWAVVYLHVSATERVETGARLEQGDRIGHPSCEGGYSTGTHLHIARTYNGRWVSADSPTIPFVMDGWRAGGSGSEYNGFLMREGVTRSASIGRIPENSINR